MKIFNFILLTLVPTLLMAQMAPSVISSSGGYNGNEDFSISWTLGELSITTLHANNLGLTQGFQQPLDMGTSIKTNEIDWNISVYPNPVHNELNIRFDLKDKHDYLLEIQDVTGRMLILEIQRNVMPGDIKVLNTSGIASGVYFLRILTVDFRLMKAFSLRKI